MSCEENETKEGTYESFYVSYFGINKKSLGYVIGHFLYLVDKFM